MLYCCGAVSQDCRRADISSCEDCEWYRIVFFHHKGRNPSGPVMGSPIRGINPFPLPLSPSILCFAVFSFFSPVRPMANLPRRREDQRLRMVRRRALSLSLTSTHRPSDTLTLMPTHPPSLSLTLTPAHPPSQSHSQSLLHAAVYPSHLPPPCVPRLHTPIRF